MINGTYPDGAVVEEEAERGRGGERRERHGLLHGAADNALEVRADAGVVVRPQLRLGRRHRREREQEDGGQELEAPHGTATRLALKAAVCLLISLKLAKAVKLHELEVV